MLCACLVVVNERYKLEQFRSNVGCRLRHYIRKKKPLTRSGSMLNR